MRSSEANFSFPVLGFTPDRENWGFPDLDRLTKCGARTLRENMQAGMELIDSDGQRWRVLSVRRTGRAGSLLSLLPGFGPPQSRIEHELEELAALSLAEVKQRTVDSLNAFRSDYMGFEGDEAEFSALLEKVSQAQSFADIYDLIQPDTFESY
ncbi:hypothetical protein [Phenylobacterium sp.]|uniref:hypothetical protein n=1 Tax=Phenylobacterium sp. TaxID=1871053 RepID=UPI002810DF76|nr:hypothetical protein [Phenylobacterium sp.]